METAASKKDIINFAQKYIDFFEKKFGSDKSKYWFFGDDYFAKDCEALGFEMDCGQAFIAVDKDSWPTSSVLKDNLDKFTDINIIGSGLYSKWRAFNHWGSPLEAKEDTKQWYLILLRRLIVLCSQD
ncbi:MAG: hypothetical protein J5767_14075 [Paludibacteraceae bacterium]|nr:hypothetical protein [Paludibacteraceae bacterium]